jgi:hypothetical protein
MSGLQGIACESLYGVTVRAADITLCDLALGLGETLCVADVQGLVAAVVESVVMFA